MSSSSTRTAAAKPSASAAIWISASTTPCVILIPYFVVVVFVVAICFCLSSQTIFAPIPGGFLAHDTHIRENIHHIILNEIELIPGFRPRLTVHLFKPRLERIILALVDKPALKICQMGNGAAEALHFIEYAQENGDDGILGLLACHFAFGINIEQDNVRRNSTSKAHISKDHPIADFLVIHKVIN